MSQWPAQDAAVLVQEQGGRAREFAAPAQKKLGIIVAGMHRAGTSAVTRVVNLLGADLATDLMPPFPGDNDRGFWEPLKVVEIHDRLLGALGSSYDDPLPLPEDWLTTAAAVVAKRELGEEIEKDFKGSSLFAVKDPRVARLLPLWLALLDERGIEPVIVIPIRNPLEVARSLGRREGLPLAQSLLVYARSYLETEVASRGRRRFFVRYDQLLSNWRILEDKLRKALGTAMPRAKSGLGAEIEEFLTRDLYRNRATFLELKENSQIADTVIALYDRMADAADSDSEAGLQEAFDRLRSIVAEATKLFQGLVIAERDRHRAELAAFKRDHDAATARLTSDVTALKSRTDELAAAMELRSGELTAARIRTAELEQALHDARGHTESLAQELAHEKAGYQADLARKLVEIDHLQATLSSTSIRLSGVLTSTSWRITAPLRGVAGMAPAPARYARRAAQVFWWTVTFQLMRRFRAWRARRRQAALIGASDLFDRAWYLERYPDVRSAGVDPVLHYLDNGAAEGRNPSASFDSEWYLQKNPDVRRANLNPLVHYLIYGAKERRDHRPVPVLEVQRD